MDFIVRVSDTDSSVAEFYINGRRATQREFWDEIGSFAYKGVEIPFVTPESGYQPPAGTFAKSNTLDILEVIGYQSGDIKIFMDIDRPEDGKDMFVMNVNAHGCVLEAKSETLEGVINKVYEFMTALVEHQKG